MKQIPGKHRLPLPTHVDQKFLLDIVQLVEARKLHESRIQVQIDQLSATYYYVPCDIEAYNIRKGILALEKEKYKLHSETNVYLSEITSHHYRISHVVFQYHDARLEEDSYLESEANRKSQITRIIETHDDKQKHIIIQQQREK